MATASLLGLPADRLVYGDTFERIYWAQVVARAVELDVVRRDNQAMANANAISQLLTRLFRRRGRAR